MNQHGLDVTRFQDIFHFAAIVGGRSKVDGDPMLVAQDLSIDAEMFLYVCRNKPDRFLYPSSSRCLPHRPADREQHTLQLKEAISTSRRWASRYDKPTAGASSRASS
ncbi:MAG: hypothetical protein R2810_13320 [Flavobacteriales bacterium]